MACQIAKGLEKVKNVLDNYDEFVEDGFEKMGEAIRKVDEKVTKTVTKGTFDRTLTVSKITKELGEITFDYKIGQAEINEQAAKVKEFLDNRLTADDSVLLHRALTGDMRAVRLPERLKKIYSKMRNLIDSNAKRLIEAGALKEEYAIKDYLKRYYVQHLEDSNFVSKMYFTKRFKSRKNLTHDERIAMGMLEDSNFVIPKTLSEQRIQLLKANTLKRIADKYGKDVEYEGYIRISNETNGGGIYKYGALAGKWVNPKVADAVKGAGLVKENLGLLEKYLFPLIDHIKVNVTVKNPFTHIYNIGSNLMLTYLHGDMGAMTEVLGMLANDKKAFDALVAKANKYGLNSYLGELEAPMGLKIGKEPLIASIFKNLYFAKGTKPGDAVRKLYDWEDKIFKVAAFYKYLKAGMPEKKAFLRAQDSYVNYDTPLPAVVRNLDKSGLMPFIHYSYKSTPMVLKTIAKHPVRFTLMQTALMGVGASAWLGDNKEDNLYKPKWAESGKLPNVMGVKSWFKVNDSWYLNAGRLVPGMRFDGFDTLEFGGGFIRGGLNILGGKTPLGYQIGTKYDSLGMKVTKRALEMVKNYLPPITFGRYAQQLAGKVTGLNVSKNYYNEDMGYVEMLIRGIGVRHFNEQKEVKSKARAVRNIKHHYTKKAGNDIAKKREIDKKYQEDIKPIKRAAKKVKLELKNF